MNARWALTLLALVVCGCTADLRPEPLDERASPQEPERARQLLLDAAQAQHLDGAEPWLEQPGVEVTLRDGYLGLFGFVARPWPENPQPLTIRFRPGQDDGWLEFESGDQREAWGIVDWNTWRREGDEPPEWGQDSEITFWIPTLEYFLELPLRVGRDAGILDLAEPAEYEGELCDRVYVTWGSYEPGELDQYLVWIRQRDGLVVRADFTVRDFYDFIHATVRYSDHRDVGGYLLPHTIEIGDAPPEDVFHVIEVESWRTGVALPESELAPGGAPKPRRKPG